MARNIPVLIVGGGPVGLALAAEPGWRGVRCELIEQGDFSGVKEAMEKSLAEGSQTFEQDLARLINTGVITRDEGLAFADSPTNLMWRLQNDFSKASKAVELEVPANDEPNFSEFTLDVHQE